MPPGSFVAVVARGSWEALLPGAIVLAAVLLLGVIVWIVRAIFATRRRRGRRWWPVRPETVGPRLWPIVRPKVVIVATGLQVAVAIWIYLPPPWPGWVDPALCLLALLALLAVLYWTEVRGLWEDWVRYRPRADGARGDDRTAGL